MDADDRRPLQPRAHRCRRSAAGPSRVSIARAASRASTRRSGSTSTPRLPPLPYASIQRGHARALADRADLRRRGRTVQAAQHLSERSTAQEGRLPEPSREARAAGSGPDVATWSASAPYRSDLDDDIQFVTSGQGRDQRRLLPERRQDSPCGDRAGRRICALRRR